MLEVEKEVLELWDREKTFEASLKARREAKPFVFYEGPPTANGKPGVHHVISRSIKDFACRWKTMQGFLVERKAGWDTHGLPVEIAAEKKLGLEGKDAIERLGIAEFNRVCRESVFQYLTDWEAMTRRIGYWVDMKQAYVTCSNEYVESLWAILADLHGRGLLYKGHKVLPYCPRCGTPLSSHEVGQGFKDVQDPSVFVRFRALDAAGAELPEAFLVWTTTPWTLPSNVALAVHPDVDYVRVRVPEGDGRTEVLWLAEPRLSALKAKPGTVEVLEKVKGKALVGRRYRRLLDLYDVPAAPNAFTVRPAAFVTTEDGTGIVHMAPAYGEDDASVGRRDALPVLHPVDAAGRFTSGPRASLVEGKLVKDADKDVLRQLKADGALLRQETLVHSYPHCWRCDTPLLYYARDSWYLKTTQFRERMLELNAAVKWFPESTGSGRFGQWLENNVDWALSRDRYWGTPCRSGCARPAGSRWPSDRWRRCRSSAAGSRASSTSIARTSTAPRGPAPSRAAPAPYAAPPRWSTAGSTRGRCRSRSGTSRSRTAIAWRKRSPPTSSPRRSTRPAAGSTRCSRSRRCTPTSPRTGAWCRSTSCSTPRARRCRSRRATSWSPWASSRPTAPTSCAGTCSPRAPSGSPCASTRRTSSRCATASSARSRAPISSSRCTRTWTGSTGSSPRPAGARRTCPTAGSSPASSGSSPR